MSVGGFSIMDNHLHVLVRLDPDVAQAWSDEEVVRRWGAKPAGTVPLPALARSDILRAVPGVTNRFFSPIKRGQRHVLGRDDLLLLPGHVRAAAGEEWQRVQVPSLQKLAGACGPRAGIWREKPPTGDWTGSRRHRGAGARIRSGQLRTDALEPARHGAAPGATSHRPSPACRPVRP